MPIMNYTGSTAIFGRAFLKAVYLAVNYETDEFQVAPASFSTEKDVQAFTSPVNGAKSWPTKKSKNLDPDDSDGVISPLMIGGVVGGGLLLIAIILGFTLLSIKKKKDQTRKHSQDFGYSYQNSDFCSSSSSDKAHSEHSKAKVTTTKSRESNTKIDLSAGADLGDRSNEALLIPPGHYEYGGYIHNKRLPAKLDTTTLTYPTTYIPHKETYGTVPTSEVCEPTIRAVTSSPYMPYRPADYSPVSPQESPISIKNQVAPSPVAPFSPYSPYAIDNLWKKLPQPPHMRVHEMPC
ncbi:hypothetical protein L873DRAFT_209787 [Choiromyces venosus 120613-1]|uniref:Peptidase A1 domain-containing protein n=1 Tax=Choiromyces venosus 120613-1 TaxID=1336337 RepID=A0A3N4J1K2_9PEZI|nr:hypothetical protein L873DRAFT_209787 [Choiromyces venosus 120613-1]